MCKERQVQLICIGSDLYEKTFSMNDEAKKRQKKMGNNFLECLA